MSSGCSLHIVEQHKVSRLLAGKFSDEDDAAQVGISAPQGCGKTTVVEQLEKLLQRAGKSCASVSIDDFYLRNADQRALAAANPDNRLLQCRGNAGTHDLQLGADTLARLVTLGCVCRAL